MASPYPFKPGERLVYDIGFSKSILSGSLGELDFEVLYPAQNESQSAVPPSPNQGGDGSPADADPRHPAGPTRPTPVERPRDEIEFKARLTSKGFYTWILGVNVQDTYESLVNSTDLGLSRFVKLTDQSNLHRREDTAIDRIRGLATYTDIDPGNAASLPKVKVVSCPPWVLDIMSAFYFIRSRDLKEGETMVIPLTDSGRVFDIEVVAGRYETVDFKSGKVRALPLDVRIFDGRYVKRSGQLTVWISDDRSHVPVRAKVKTNGLTINVVLERLPQ